MTGLLLRATGPDLVTALTAGLVLALVAGIAMLAIRSKTLRSSLLLSAARVRELESIETELRASLETVEHEMSGLLMANDTHERNSSELARAVEELDDAKRLAEEAVRTKAVFVATVSHELRTPLNGVIGISDLLLGTDLTDDQAEYVEAARSSAEILLTLINDILDVSKMEAGKLELERRSFQPRATADTVLMQLSGVAEGRGLELGAVVASDVPAVLEGDATRLQQILTNLIGNALKFTPSGKVWLEVERSKDGEEDGNVALRFSVHDTGIGISSSQMDRLFKSFSQADTSTTRKYGGTGLGLSISKRLTELMGGEIGVESEEGAGSTFWFTIRVPVVEQQPSFQAARLPEGLNVLLAGPLDLQAQALAQSLAFLGIPHDRVDSLEQVPSRMAHPGAEGRGPTTLIVPFDADQEQTLERVRALRGEAKLEATVAFCNPQSWRAISERAEKVFDTTLSRPVRLKSILRCLAGRRSGPQDDRVESGPAFRSTPRLLLAEDNVVNQKVATRMLEKIGCDVTTAANGAQAVAQVERHDFDLILMDCRMPGVDGFAAMAQIRARDDERAKIPIIALTADAGEGDRERCLAAGMDDYLAKPFRQEQLNETVRRNLEHLLMPLGSEPLAV
ncbi:MAG: ATP-binding protein [Planctomycetota bacterium]